MKNKNHNIKLIKIIYLLYHFMFLKGQSTYNVFMNNTFIFYYLYINLKQKLLNNAKF